MRSLLIQSLIAAHVAYAQHVKSPSCENHPKLTTWKCTKDGGCSPQRTAIVLDSLKRPLYQVDAPNLGCGTNGSPPNTTVCPDVDTCQANCVMESISDYSKVGVKADDDRLYLDMLNDDTLAKISPRVYLLDEHDENYEMLHLLGQEISFDVDVSKLPCGMNGAFYLSEMEEDGGRSEINQAGPAFGTGYCDAQCYIPPFINGETCTSIKWDTNARQPNIQGSGACCNELDIWEANSRATHLAPHTCNITGLYACQGAECGKSGVCDKPGCHFNPANVGNGNYYGLGMIVDTTRPFKVVTQFPTDSAGELQAIHRFYVQDGAIFENPSANKSSLPQVNYIDDEFCDAMGADIFKNLGGTTGMGQALDRGMVLCMSVWWDESGGNMNWLDGPGSGPCSAAEGSPNSIRQAQPDTAVTFSKIKWGDIGSTYGGA
ncbi:unnamed protein product [Clonostachys byssicola]|uniref:Glucanase n=1 Tax=Clonostachys byssicola TaxID=160290 RepID=A0A9N9UCA2_9HYPO|nr:unnamed protein product [Clonostachys byssicola]